MSEWQKVKIGDFLYKTSVLGESIENADELQHLGVSNKLGITITDHKKSKDISKHQYIEQNYFAYNPYRINVGSIGLTPENVVGLVSPAYVVFKTKEHLLLPELLLNFLKSSDGLFQINKLARGTVRKALRFSELCDVEMVIPPIENQQKILKIKQSLQKEIDLLSGEFSTQQTYLTQLRQAILQEAIEGKLTADWRVKNPVQKGNPDFDAVALLEKIKAEKQRLIAEGKIKKEKPLAPIKSEDVPFKLPDGWVWVRLGGLFEIQRGSSPRPKGDPRYWIKKRTEHHWITIADLAKHSKNGVLQDTTEFLTEEGAKLSRFVTPADLLVAASGVGSVGKSSKLGISGYIYDGLMAIKNINDPFTKGLIALFLKIKELTIYDVASGSNWLNINTDILSNYVFALPPLAEQQAIVERVDRLLNQANQLELQVTERKDYAQQLMQAVLREAFAE